MFQDCVCVRILRDQSDGVCGRSYLGGPILEEPIGTGSNVGNSSGPVESIHQVMRLVIVQCQLAAVQTGHTGRQLSSTIVVDAPISSVS